MIKYSLLILIIKVLILTASHAQVKLHILVSSDYSYGFPIGDLNSYISEKTYDGVHFQYRHFLKRNFSLGGRGGWNNFNDELPRNVYETDRGTVSAIQTRSFYSMPILLTGHYYLRSLHYVMPYVGIGVGGYLVKYEKYFGVVPTDKQTFNAGFSPEIGIIFPFKNSGLGIMINGRFNKVFYSHNEVGNLQYAELSLGIYFGDPEFEDP